MRPFDFQIECLRDTSRFFQQGFQRVVLVAGCGAGKTYMAGMMLYSVVRAGQNRGLFLVDRNTLLEQSAAEFEALGIRCTILQGYRPVDWDAPVIVASCQTIEARLKDSDSAGGLVELIGHPSLIIADECHETAWRPSFEYLDATYTPRGSRILGLTATPWRTRPDEYLGQKFDAVVAAPQPPDLVRLGRIVPCRGYSLDGIFDYKSLGVGRDGDFLEADLERQALNQAALEFVVQQWFELANGLKSVAFCPSVTHAQKLADAFQAAGISADWQDGTTKDTVRRQQDNDLASSKLMVLCSVGTLGKGWSNKAVECVLFTFPTQSKARFFQGAGRGSRADGIKNHYVLLDFGDNLTLHGSPTGFQDYSIDQKIYKEPGEAMLKSCPYCRHACSQFLKLCPMCGYRFSSDLAPEIPEIDLASVWMIEHLSEEERAQLRFFRKAKQICYQHNLSPDIAVQQFRKRYGFEPYSEWHFRAVLGDRYSAQEQMQFVSYLQQHSPNAQWFTFQVHLECGRKGRPILVTRPTPIWWEVLGVAQDAAFAEIQQAYLAQFETVEYGGSTDSAYQIRKLNWAWEQAVAQHPLPLEH